jgi:hypothetical protein
MGQEIRRVQRTEIVIADNPDYLPVVKRQDKELTVSSQLRLGMQPAMFASWEVPSWCWRDGFRLMIFRSATGFAPDRRAKDLSTHGQLIREEATDGTFEEHLPEGTHYYTYLLHRKGLLFEHMCIVRFSETVPSAKVAIGRMKDVMELQRLSRQHERWPLEDEIESNDLLIRHHRSMRHLENATQAARPAEDSLEAKVRRQVEQKVATRLVRARTRVEFWKALEAERRRLRSDPDWRRLSRQQRDRILEEIANDLDADEANVDPDV